MDLYRLSGGADLSALNLPNILFEGMFPRHASEHIRGIASFSPSLLLSLCQPYACWNGPIDWGT